MKISIITVFPELYDQFVKTSIIGKALEKELISFNIVKLSDLCEPKKRIDEPVCGPGTGMIIKPEIIEKAIESCEEQFGPGYKIFFSPQGKKITQKVLQQFTEEDSNFLPNFIESKTRSSVKAQSSPKDHLILVCSRYEGIDERVQTHFADAIFSIGDYVLMGGDLPAQVFLEGYLRLLPDVVGKQESVEDESFSDATLDYPEYGLPQNWKSYEIPEIVLSGNHGAIESWRQEEAMKKTILERFDWFRASSPSEEKVAQATKQIPSHYVAVMHTDVMIKGGRIGCSSVTSLDLHDIARSSATYGIKNMFMVSPLKDQLAIMDDLLAFWKSKAGQEYNKSRFDAVSRVVAIESLQATIDFIEKQEGKKPLVITTSAKIHDHQAKIDYFCQGKVWKENRPVLFIFGTAQGLREEIITESDFLLVPVGGMTNYKHLSVRSAVAIILDRWLGLNPNL